MDGHYFDSVRCQLCRCLSFVFFLLNEQIQSFQEIEEIRDPRPFKIPCNL